MWTELQSGINRDQKSRSNKKKETGGKKAVREMEYKNRETGGNKSLQGDGTRKQKQMGISRDQNSRWNKKTRETNGNK